MKLLNKVAIVTGGGTGIGRAISLVFADEGAKLVLAARNLIRIQELVDSLKSKGIVATAVRTDISDHEQVKRLMEQTVKEYGQIDVLVNNAAQGTYNNADVADMNLEEWHKSLAINLTGAMLCAKEALKYMIPHRYGSIVNVASVAGMSGVPRESPYAATKWGLIGLTETMAIEAGKYGIRVNSISPGATRTSEFDDWVNTSAKDAGITYEAMMGKITRNNSLGRIAEPSEIAKCVLFLASDDSSAVTGHNLVASCGFHIVHPNMIQ